MLIKGQCREAPPLACFYMAPRSVAPEILLKALSSGVLRYGEHRLTRVIILCPCVLLSKTNSVMNVNSGLRCSVNHKL